MKLVNRATFLAMPAGTVYAKYTPCYFEDLAIKDDSLAGGVGDWFYQCIADAIEPRSTGDFVDALEGARETGCSIPMSFDALGRDGLFEADQMFAVWEPQDVRALIERLQRSLRDVER